MQTQSGTISKTGAFFSAHSSSLTSGTTCALPLDIACSFTWTAMTVDHSWMSAKLQDPLSFVCSRVALNCRL